MNVIMDACSIINLHNGGVLRDICRIEGLHIQVGPIVGGECSEDCALAIANLHTDGDLEYLEDNVLEIDEFLKFVEETKLGDGESECILLANLNDHSSICCDDRRGRIMGAELLGEDRVFGSLKLLKIAVQNDIIQPIEAFEAFELMRAAGGFLPTITLAYFQE